MPYSSQYIHLASLGLVAFSIMLLMSPAAFHRIAEAGQDTERVQRFASGMILAAMILLALGLGGDLFVVARKITDSVVTGIGVTLAALCMFYGLWFGYTFYIRYSDRSEQS